MTSGAGRSRAVLFGVHAYDELSALDGVRHNVPTLLPLLTSKDVGGLAEEDCTVVPHGASQQKLLDALQDAADEATDLLLVYYAGHGHFGGRDRTFHLATQASSVRRAYHSVKYDDVRDLVSGSAAQRKVVIVDCCFSGRALPMSDEKAPTQLDMEITGACVLTSAAETERSLCLPEGSVFTLELTALLSEGLAGELTGGRQGEHLPELTMTDVFNALHGRLQGRTVDGFRVPQPRMSTRDLGHQIVLATNRAFTGSPADRNGSATASAPDDHEWVAATRDHPLWNYVADERGLTVLRETATALVARAASAIVREENLAEDPWHSPSYTDRVAEWTDSLLLDSSFRPEDLELSAAEVFLLVTHPYLHAVFWKGNARRYKSVGPTRLTDAQSTSSARRSYERFLREYPRLVRRALRASGKHASSDVSGKHASDAIGWWLFHRWLIRQPRLYDSASVETLLDDLAVPLGKSSLREKRLVEEVLEPELVAQLLRAPQLSKPQEEGKARPRTVGTAETAQRVRVHQLTEMLHIAHLFAMDPIALPDVVVDHIGIGYAVDLPSLHSTLAHARWHSNGRTRSLSATCGHLAIDVGLRQHAATLDTRLARIDISTGDEERPALLRNLPLHVTADQVAPAAETSGRPIYASTELRFRLADDRIQELLMGEELYGDPALAIRELYQNALDACRYRDARTRYLRATGVEIPPYRGTISFTQGVDEAGPYLECRDNGIGMGEVELRDVFSHAGMRFADLPEYIEERARWEEHGITMHPNSQFGVGVLSYFMLADDITVTTCRLTPDGLPGQHLRVEIAGPGSLFRIQPLDRCAEAYTSVRLRLRSPDATSCVDVLRRILWLSEFEVTAREGEEEPTAWVPNVLSEVAPLGALDAYTEGSFRQDGARTAATSTPAVWWCNTQGAVLADGLWAGKRLFGAVVNLSGERTPRLTVDRRRIIEPNMAEVELMLRQEIHSLLGAGAEVFRHSWLKRFLLESPSVADEIFAEAVRLRFAPWQIAGREVDITRSGFFAADDILGLSDSKAQPLSETYLTPPTAQTFRCHPLADAGFFPGFTTSRSSSPALPRPSDTFILLPYEMNALRPLWLKSVFQESALVGVGMLTRVAAEVDRPVEEVAARLEELGFAVPAPPFPRLDENDLRFISGQLDGWTPWLDPRKTVHPSHVILATSATGHTGEHVMDRLTALGYRTPKRAVAVPEADDLLILSVDLDGEAPWLPLTTPVVPAHITSAAARTGRSVEEVAARLESLGFSVPTSPLPLLSDADLRLIGADHRPGSRPEFSQGLVHPAHIMQVAGSSGRSVAEITDRLIALGYTVPTRPVPTPQPDDLRLLSQQCSGQAPWLPLDQTVHPAHIAMVAKALGRSTADVASRLTEYGYVLPDIDLPDLQPADLRIVSRDLDAQPPWLTHDDPVSLIHIARAAATLELHPHAVADQLEGLGYRLPDYTVRSTEAPVRE
ncbi:peptidase C14 caspase catalytic subunit p20 [Streptomyces sp. CBMAI 2042]|uniref:caspase, EACC1-associated type n=1 Tax=Streptomyces sp. CBMAI 2042 TaxID=2305222 RepID=UPI000F2563D3|nr:caspase family protein [Streptomyces sp. CBMAI 2042]RLV70984.1 peptidase C14 caspase catalytic subunit p20 [Streptomyces sp. CBMAI 2042]